MDDVYQKSLKLHEKAHGKLAIVGKVPLETMEDLSVAYTPGMAEVCREIVKNPDNLYRYTMKSNMVAMITDGSAVLGLGNIGAAASLPVMEGKCLLLKRFANVDAFPICVETQDVEEFIKIVKNIAVGFGGINLEDISAPRCFEIEERLKKELPIPVFHDDQHGTAIVVLAALINALKLAEKKLAEVKIVMSGSGAAGVATAKLLLSYGAKNLILCDRHGAIYKGRADLDESKEKMAEITNLAQEKGSLATVIAKADIFVGVSSSGLVTAEMVKTMAPKAIILAMANPTPEIMPDIAKAAGGVYCGYGSVRFSKSN